MKTFGANAHEVPDKGAIDGYGCETLLTLKHAAIRKICRKVCLSHWIEDA